MKFFIDTANVEEIRSAYDMGIICGCTTNPSLIAKEGRDYVETLKEIASFLDGPISGEVKADTVKAEDMILEGREIASLSPNMVVKIPMTEEGLKAVKVLSKEGIKTNVTLIFSATQAVLAARAGATYVSPFLGRLDDISSDGLILIQDRGNLCICSSSGSCNRVRKDRSGYCNCPLQGFEANDSSSFDRYRY